MSGHGGARPGAGRKPGSSTVRRRSPEIEKGVLPLEMRLIVARKMWAEAVDGNGVVIDLEKARAAAEFAEPAARFTSPTLSSIEASVNVTNHEAALDELDGEPDSSPAAAQ